MRCAKKRCSKTGVRVKTKLILCAAAALAVGASVSLADPTPIFHVGDPARAFDADAATGSSSYPANENPPKLIDGLFTGATATKYLNFGREGSGYIVIPSGPSVVQSFQLYTANDDDRRDPMSFQLFGTNSPVLSPDNSNGLSEPWTLISSGPLNLPAGTIGRLSPGGFVDVSNSTSYGAYKMFFPTLRAPGGGNCCMQVGEAQFYSGLAGSGDAILAPSNNIRAIDDPLGGSQSSYPVTPTLEGPAQALDQNTATKYLNFGRERSGLIVTPSVGASIADGIQFTTANDAPSRDPVLIALYGTNDPITSPDNGFGTSENWNLIVDNLPYVPAAAFNTPGPIVSFPNSTPWNSYKIVILENRGPDTGDGNSIQFSEVQLYNGAVPEPTTLALSFAGAVGVLIRRRRA
jgi:PEP-CTERM motif-containing protein